MKEALRVIFNKMKALISTYLPAQAPTGVFAGSKEKYWKCKLSKLTLAIAKAPSFSIFHSHFLIKFRYQLRNLDYRIPVVFLLSMLLLISGCFFAEETSLRSGLDLEGEALQVLKKGNDETKNVLTEIGENPKIRDYLKVAKLNNPDLKKAFYRWQAKVEDIPQMRALPNPTISYSNYLEEVETRVGAQKQKISLMQMVPWPMKIRTRTDVAVRKALSAKYLYEAENLRVEFRVIRAYAEYYYLGRSIKIVEENFELLKSLEESIQTNYSANSVSSSILNRTQVELGKLEDRIKSLQAFRVPLSANLSVAVGVVAKEIFPFPKNLPSNLPQIDETKILVSGAKDNPGLMAARKMVAAAQARERFAKAQYFPDFGFGASYIQTDKRTDMNVDENGKDPLMVSIELSIPLWWQKYSAGVRGANASRQAEEEDLTGKELRLTSDLKMACYQYLDAGRKENLFNETLVPKAEQALETSLTAFSSNKISFTDLIDAERSLLELRLLAERARVNRNIKLAKIEMLSGKKIPTKELIKGDNGE